MSQQAFGIRFGKPKTDSIVAVGCSLVTGDITITFDGGSANITLSATEVIGDVGGTLPQAGYVNTVTISGLQPYTKYNYTATQNGNTISGYFWTAPEIDDDFILIPITCDNNTSLGGDPAGGYTQVKVIAKANPDKGVYFLHIDDNYGYMDLCALDDDTTGTTGHKVTGVNASAGGTVYDYALGAFSAFGLFSTAGNSYCTATHNADRQWCMRNIPVLPTMGDHDAGADDMGWNVDPAVAGLSQFTASQVVWEAFLAPFQGAKLTANTQNWSHTLGCVKIVAPDAISLASGQGVDAAYPTSVFGTAQVTDLIAAFDDDTVPFKILALANGIRYLTDNGLEFNDGSQHALGGNPTFVGGHETAAHVDYAELLTDAGGLMSLPSCNGKSGALMSVHGDHHMAKVMRNASAEGTFNEWFYSINVGTINGSVNFGKTGMSDGMVVDESTVEILRSGSLTGGANGHDWWVVPMYVYGSREIKEIEVDFMDRNGATLWNKKFTERSMNEAIDIDFNPNANGSGSDTGGLGN